MKTSLTLIAVVLIFISQGFLSTVPAQWIPYKIDGNAGDVRPLRAASQIEQRS